MEIDLKTYTSRAKELEVALYTQKRLMERYEATIDNNIPVEPEQEIVEEPKKPDPPKEPMKYSVLGVIVALLISAGLSLLFGWLGSITGEDVNILIFFPLKWILYILCAICALFFFGGIGEEIGYYNKYIDETEKYKIKLDGYHELIKSYDTSYKNYIHRKKQIEEQHKKDIVEYSVALSNYNEKHRQITAKNEKAYNELTTALEALYAENIIFPKYQNIIAITSINEYLLSGRCDKLEGPDGAYNIYENELRQNTIIGQLSLIIDDLEQVRQNQYTLYQELQKSNRMVNEIIYDIANLKSDTKMLTYFSNVTAIAATSPKNYYGVII